MVMIGWLIVVDRAKPSMADAAWCVHGFEPGAVFSAEITVAVSWVTHDGPLGYKKRMAALVIPFHDSMIQYIRVKCVTNLYALAHEYIMLLNLSCKSV